MKDSRLGTMGLVAIVFGLALKWGGISGLSANRALLLVVVPAGAAVLAVDARIGVSAEIIGVACGAYLVTSLVALYVASSKEKQLIINKI